MTKLMAAEQLVQVRRFYPEQLAGLREIRWTFNMEIQPLSIEQLLEDEAVSPLFGYVSPSRQMRDVVPVARQIAVNPDEFFNPNSGSLSFDDQCQMIEDVVRELRAKNLKQGTLDGINFAIDQISAYAQLDFEFQRRLGGRDLIVGAFARTIDEVVYHSGVDSGLVVVGRQFWYDRLDVLGWYGRGGLPGIQVALVATPNGNR